MTTEILLGVALEPAVVLRIEALRRLDACSFARRFELDALDRLAQTICEHGDVLLFRSRKAGESAAVFNAVADGIALLAFCPGGICIFGQHWQATR